MGKKVAKISDEAMGLLSRYAWPGNVRELENVMERAVALEPTEAILPERLPETLRGGAPAGSPAVEIGPGFSLDDHLRVRRGDLLMQALEKAQGDRAEAARILGVTPRSLRYLIQKHAAARGQELTPATIFVGAARAAARAVQFYRINDLGDPTLWHPPCFRVRQP